MPLVSGAFGSSDATAAISRTHAEIGWVRRLIRDLDNDDVQPGRRQLRRPLYGLYAVLRLHHDQGVEGAGPEEGRRSRPDSADRR